jgi:hypothetical protein
MRKKTVKIDDIKENPNNRRTITKAQFKVLRRSIKRYGLIDPLIVDKNNVLLAGHQRLKVLRQRGEKEMEVLEVDGGDLKGFNKVNDYDIGELGVKFESSNLFVDWRGEEIKNAKVKVLKASRESKSTTVSASKLVGNGRISWEIYNSNFDKIVDEEFWYKFLDFINETK